MPLGRRWTSGATGRPVAGGTVEEAAAVAAPEVSAPQQPVAVTAAEQVTWTSWLNTLAAADDAPSWSAGLTAKPGAHGLRSSRSSTFLRCDDHLERSHARGAHTRNDHCQRPQHDRRLAARRHREHVREGHRCRAHIVSTPYQGYEPPRRTRPLHLLWAVPLSVAGALAALAFASFEWCGITACRWGDRGSPLVVGLATLLAGAMVSAPFWLIRWTARTPVRIAVGVVLGLAVWVGGWYWVTHPAP